MRENDQIDSQVSIQLHRTTAQDLLADLGKPSHIFYKEQDKMKIHSLNDNGKEQQPEILDPNQSTEHDKQLHSPTDYFFNYFHLGLDILIDGGLHVCKKVVLHTNVPGHYDFGRYKRCPFTLVFPSQEKLPDKGDKGKNSLKKENKSQIETKENKKDDNPIIEDNSGESQESNDDEKTDMKGDKSDQSLQLKTDGSESVATANMKVKFKQNKKKAVVYFYQRVKKHHFHYYYLFYIFLKNIIINMKIKQNTI
jgi:hypothetical protein